jgi:ubiquinone/menaquinone biosynthesis C-methylase UbiE
MRRDMSSIISIILSVLLWMLIVLISWFIFVEVIIRVVRRFVHFPVPAFIARFIDNPIRRRIQPPKKVIDWIGIQDGMCVLEIGPGPGTFTIEAAKRVGEKGKVFAIDIQPTVISKLNSRLQREGVKNVVTKVASAYELPFSNNTFDRVFMIAVLAEIPDKKKALLEIKRVLRDDGLLAIGEFLPDPDYPRPKTVIHWCKDAGFELVNRYGGILHYLLTFRNWP